MKQYCSRCMNELVNGSFCMHCMQETKEDIIPYHLRQGTVINNRYLIGNYLGEGGFGITYIGRDLVLDRRVAVKELYPNGYVHRSPDDHVVKTTTDDQKAVFEKSKDRFLAEARAIALFSGESGVVDVRDYFEANGTAYIIMDYLEGENLSAYIKKNGVFDAKTIFTLILPITASLRKIHEKNMIHRDISPENIIYLKDGTLKLTDFGNARLFTESQKETSVMLKRGYAPIEQYSRKGNLGPWTDVYGMCATLYKCVTGRTPPDALERGLDNTLFFPENNEIQIPTAFKNIIRYGMSVRSDDRCPDMVVLSDMINKALKGEDNKVIAASHVSVTEFNTAQYADGFNSRTADTAPGALNSNAGGGDQKKGNSAVAAAVVIISIAVLMAAVAGILILKWDRNNEELSSQAAAEQSAQSAMAEVSGNESSSDQSDTNQAESSQEVSQASDENSKDYSDVLSDEINRAKLELRNYISGKAYREEEMKAVESCIASFSQKLDNAGSVDEIRKLKKQYQESIDEIKTDDDLNIEESERAAAEESSRLAEESSRLEEESRIAEESRLAEESRQRAEEESSRLAEEQSKWRAEEESRRLAEEESRRKSEEENLTDATYFTDAKASSTLPDEGRFSYSATNVLRHDASCWCENAAGYGEGEWIELTLPEKQRLNGLQIINGYAGTEEQYEKNAKVTQIRIEFSDGTWTIGNLLTMSTDERLSIQRIQLPYPVYTSYVRITITGTESAECEDTCITYIAPI